MRFDHRTGAHYGPSILDSATKRQKLSLYEQRMKQSKSNFVSLGSNIYSTYKESPLRLAYSK